MKLKSLLLCNMLLGTSTSNAAILFEQSAPIQGTGGVLRASRVPVTYNGTVKYYDFTFAFQQDASGFPVLAPLYPVITLSPTLFVGSFKAGKYKDGQGNVYTVGGPGAASGGRTSWSVLLTKQGSCSGCNLSGSWTTGPIAGHPIEATLKEQSITSTGFSWGSVAVNFGGLYGCLGDAVGYSQAGNVLSINGYCSHTAVQTYVLTLSLCTTADPCP